MNSFRKDSVTIDGVPAEELVQMLEKDGVAFDLSLKIQEKTFLVRRDFIVQANSIGDILVKWKILGNCESVRNITF